MLCTDCSLREGVIKHTCVKYDGRRLVWWFCEACYLNLVDAFTRMHKREWKGEVKGAESQRDEGGEEGA